MQLKLLLILLLALLVSSCVQGPKVTVCVSDPDKDGFDCYNERNSQSLFVPYTMSDKYIALPPADAQALLSYCASK